MSAKDDDETPSSESKKDTGHTDKGNDEKKSSAHSGDAATRDVQIIDLASHLEQPNILTMKR